MCMNNELRDIITERERLGQSWLFVKDGSPLVGYPSKRTKHFLYAFFAVVSLHIIYTTSYPILPMASLFLSMFILVMMVRYFYAILYLFRPMDKGYFIIGYPYPLLALCLYTIRFVFFACFVMIVVYEITGDYIDISDSYNILHIMPDIWEYSGAKITDEPYGLANTIHIITYYFCDYVVFPFILVFGVILILVWIYDLERIVHCNIPKNSPEIKRIESALKCKAIMEVLGNVFNEWGKIKLFALTVFMLLMNWAFLSFPEPAFEEGTSPWVGVVLLENGAYYILFSIAINIALNLLFPILCVSPLSLIIVMLYYYYKYMRIHNITGDIDDE